LQLIVRNIGGGRPGEIDRATLGGPGKYTFCFAEDEAGSPWEPLSVERGFPEGTSTVTLFAGYGPHGLCDQKSREPESLARSMAWALDAGRHPEIRPRRAADRPRRRRCRPVLGRHRRLGAGVDRQHPRHPGGQAVNPQTATDGDVRIYLDPTGERTPIARTLAERPAGLEGK